MAEGARAWAEMGRDGAAGAERGWGAAGMVWVGAERVQGEAGRGLVGAVRAEGVGGWGWEEAGMGLGAAVRA